MTTKNVFTAAMTLVGDREIRVTRAFDAPRRLVFEAHANPEHLKRWWGLRNHVLSIPQMDFRVGGAYRWVSRDSDGTEYPFKGVYREITAPERLAFTFIYDVAPFDKFETITTLTLTESQGKTILTSISLYPSQEARNAHLQSGMEEGMNETYDRLEEILQGLMWAGQVGGHSELFVTRLFNAPRSLVFEAWAKPEHFRRWFAPSVLTLPVCEMDFRPGGKFRHVMRTPDGHDFPLEGTYTEIVAPEKMVWLCYLNHLTPPLEVQTTILFSEYAGKTKITVNQNYLQAKPPEGAREGWTSSLDKLAGVLEKM